jgi:hypothetical protein
MMGSRRLRLMMTAGAVASLLASAQAQAQVSAADRETARSAMQEGRDLRDKGDLKGALQRFKSADDIMHVPTTALEVARTQVSLGLLIEALDTIAAIRKTPALAEDPAPFKDARLKADELDAQVEGRVPSLTISVSGAGEGETPAISVDGVSLPAAVANVPRKVDPGHHVVSARAPSGRAKTEVDVAEGEKKDVALVLASGGESPEGENQPSDQGAEAPHGVVHTPGALTWAGIVVGGAGLITGAITGVMTLSKASSVKTECKGPNMTCNTSTGISDLNAGNSLATVSTIGFAVAGAGAALAVVSLIVGHKAPGATPSSPAPTDPEAAPGGDAAPPPAQESHLHVTPWVGVGSAGLFGTF